jgi:hypothetical protein
MPKKKPNEAGREVFKQLEARLWAEIAYDAVCHMKDKDCGESNPCPPFGELPEWKQSQYERGVRYVMAHPKLTDAEVHWHWMRDRAEHGWVRAMSKNEDRKEHPYMIAFEALPAVARREAKIFKATVRACIAKAGGKTEAARLAVLDDFSVIDMGREKQSVTTIFQLLDALEALHVKHKIPNKDEHLLKVYEIIKGLANMLATRDARQRLEAADDTTTPEP